MRTFLGPLRQHAEVTGGFIVGHGPPTPRFAAHYANVLSVPAGETFVLPPDSTYDAIEFAGTLKASQDYDTICRTIHVLDLDTTRKCEIVFRDVPLATGTVQQPGHDPEQIGNGLLVFGTFRVRGKPLEKTWTTLTAEAQAGATTIQFAVPGGWQVGDELLLPDMRQPGTNIPTRRESPVRIAAISGNVVTLNKPLDFEHHAVRRPDWSIVALPYVANITRNIVFRSENPQGTRGHVIFLEQARVDVQYAAFLGMGRTQATNIDNTSLTGSASDKIGTNQIARYGASHWHHVHGHADIDGLTGRYVGVYADGTDGAKWGFVQHGSHDIEHRDCIADRFVGAGLIAEDGNECFGTYERNLSVYCKGEAGKRNGKFAFNAGIPGGEGACFWFHGSHHIIRDNVAACGVVGFQVFHMNQVERVIPGAPAGWAAKTALPIDFRGNESTSNLRAGFESWRQPYGWIAYDHTSCHNGFAQAFSGNGEPGSISFRNPSFIGGEYPTITDKIYGLHTDNAYTSRSEIIGGEVQGCDIGIRHARVSMHFEGIKVANRVEFDLRYDREQTLPPVLKNITYLPYALRTDRVLSNLVPPPSDGATTEPPVDPDPPVDPPVDPDPPADPVAELLARIVVLETDLASAKSRVQQLETEAASFLERIIELENFRRDVKAAGE